MQVSSLVDILDGELLNNPSISFIYSIKTNAKKIKEGDLFIANNINDIPLAVKNGAFAIVLEQKHSIIDKEIAWIKVENTNIALIKLVRFKLSIINIKAYYCEEAIYDLLKLYNSSSQKHIIIIPNKLDNFLQDIDEITSNKDILISSNKELLDSLYPQNEDFNTLNESFDIKNLIEHSLFETSFSFENEYFQKLKIPSIYINSFLAVSKFLELKLDIVKLKNFHNFKPLFLDKNLNIIEFGKSDRFLLSQNKKTLVENEIKFLKEKYKYAKILFITSNDIDYIKEKNQYKLENINLLKATLKRITFNAVYLIGFNYNEIITNLTEEEKIKTLF